MPQNAPLGLLLRLAIIEESVPGLIEAKLKRRLAVELDRFSSG